MHIASCVVGWWADEASVEGRRHQVRAPGRSPDSSPLGVPSPGAQVVGILTMNLLYIMALDRLQSGVPGFCY